MPDAEPTALGTPPLVPDDGLYPEQCKTCRGTGLASKYDLGYSSLMHSDDLATKRRCPICGGQGRKLITSRNLPA